MGERRFAQPTRRKPAQQTGGFDRDRSRAAERVEHRARPDREREPRERVSEVFAQRRFRAREAITAAMQRRCRGVERHRADVVAKANGELSDGLRTIVRRCR